MQTTKSTDFFPTLVLSEHFLPNCGGTITWLLQTYGRYFSGEVVIVAGELGDTELVDQRLPSKLKEFACRWTTGIRPGGRHSRAIFVCFFGSEKFSGITGCIKSTV